MLCINTFGRVRYFPDQAKKKIQNGRTSTLKTWQFLIFWEGTTIFFALVTLTVL